MNGISMKKIRLMPFFCAYFCFDNMLNRTYYNYKVIAKQGTDITRILYFFIVGKKVVLTNGFVKKTQKTPKTEKDLAKKYKTDYERRFGDEQL